MHQAPLRLIASVALALALFTPGLPVTASNGESGEVTFRLTLEGPVSADEGFYIDVRCEGGDFCNGVDKPRYVYLCATSDVADAAICVGDTNTFEFTVSIPKQSITYDLYRGTEISRTDVERSAVVLSGVWQVHEGRQVISLGYVYPGGSTPLTLPDTAMTAP